jgi:hypothetical protein
MKRFLVALFAGATMFALVYGAAATLIVDGKTLQAGEDNDLTCDQDGIYVSAWAVNTYPVLEGVEAVKIKGVDDDCDGARILGRITLNTSVAADNSSFVYTSGTGPYSSGYSFVTASGDENTEYTLFLKESDYDTQVWVPAENIVGIKIWLEGATGDTD